MKERKHFNMRRLLTVVLMLALILSTAATGYAADLTESVCENPDPGKVIKTDWTNFRGNHTHNAVTKSPVPTKASEAALLWATKSGSGYGGQAVGSPILVDGYLYYNQGKTINKMDAISGERVASAPMVNNSSFSIVPPTYADGKIFVGLAGGIVQAFDAKTLKSLWVYTDKLGGQPNCPITYYDGYLYTGFWNSETRDANFVCLSVKDENTKKTNEAKKAKWTYTSKGGFYWAGAYVCKNFVLVGTDDGDSAYTEQTSNLLSFDPKTGAVLDKKSGLNADIRPQAQQGRIAGSYVWPGIAQVIRLVPCAKLKSIAVVQGDIYLQYGHAALQGKHPANRYSIMAYAPRGYQSGVLRAKGVPARKTAAVIDLEQLAFVAGGYVKMTLGKVVQRLAIYGGDNGHIFRAF